MIYVKKENTAVRAKVLSQTDTEVCLVSEDGVRKGVMSKEAFDAMYEAEKPKTTKTTKEEK